MKTLAELLAARAKKIDDFSALVDKMNADGYVQLKADDDAYEALRKEIADLDTQIARKKEADQLRASTATIVQPGAVERGNSQIIVPAAYRTGKLKNFRGEKAEEKALRFGHFALAAIVGNAKSLAWCKEHGISIEKAASEGVNSAGGVFVPDEFSQAIIDLRDEYGILRRLCTVYPMGRDVISVPRRTGGLTAYAVGEGVAGTQSQTAWDNVKLTANKWMVLTVMSSELDEDAVINFGDLLVGEIAYAFAVSEDTAGFTGDGSATYHGIRGLLTKFNDGLGSGATPLAGSVDAASGHDTFAEIDSTDLALLMGKLPQYVYKRGKPAWLCSQMAWAMVFQRLIMGSGGISKDDTTGQVIYQYLGFPVEIIPNFPTATTDLSDQAMLAFGDVGMAMAMGDRRGMTVARSTEYKFAEDQIAIKGTERFDINVHDIGNATVPGPVVALMGE